MAASPLEFSAPPQVREVKPMSESSPGHDKRREDAARAAWLYFIAGRTQEDIAAQLNISRQAAQRLVAFAVAENLIKFRLDHPIAACMDLADRLTGRFGLEFCDVAPSDAESPSSIRGVAIAAAHRLERLLLSKLPIIVCVGTGRTMRAAVEQMDDMDRPQHKLVSLVGNMSAAGHASPYDVVMRLGDKVSALRYPMPAQVLTETVEERDALLEQRFYTTLINLRGEAKASYMGVGQIGWRCPMHQEGFMTDADIEELLDAGAVGEITGWPFDEAGQLVDCRVTRRIASLPLEVPPQRQTVVAACGPEKRAALTGALKGGLFTGLITDEATAGAILA